MELPFDLQHQPIETRYRSRQAYRQGAGPLRQHDFLCCQYLPQRIENVEIALHRPHQFQLYTEVAIVGIGHQCCRFQAFYVSCTERDTIHHEDVRLRYCRDGAG